MPRRLRQAWQVNNHGNDRPVPTHRSRGEAGFTVCLLDCDGETAIVDYGHGLRAELTAQDFTRAYRPAYQGA